MENIFFKVDISSAGEEIPSFYGTQNLFIVLMTACH